MLLFKETPNSLHSDLYDCIGKLGVASFTFRHMDPDLRLAKEAIDAAKVYTLLRHVFEQAGLKAGRISEGEAGWARDYCAFGIPIIKDRTASATRSSILSDWWLPRSAKTDGSDTRNEKANPRLWPSTFTAVIPRHARKSSPDWAISRPRNRRETSRFG